MQRLIVGVSALSRYYPRNIFSQKILETSIKCFQTTTQKNYHYITNNFQYNHPLIKPPSVIKSSLNLLENTTILQICQNISRPVTKFSLRKGKRKTVKVVLKRFYRLNWGGWIRTKAGRHKKIWKKSAARRRRLRQHVFVNATQSWLLDKMVTKYWRRPKYYVEDPYEPYHEREEFAITRRKPI